MKDVSYFLNWFIPAGHGVLLSVFFAATGIMAGQKIRDAALTGLRIGVGLLGIQLVFYGLFVENIGPACSSIVNGLGLSSKIADAGWTLPLFICFSSALLPVVILIILTVNALMLGLNWTRTINLDIWSYWQILFCAVIIYQVTDNNWVWMITAAAISTALSLVLADLAAPYIQAVFQLPGVSFPQLSAVGWWPVVYFLNRIMERTPGLKLIRIPDGIKSRYGFLSDPAYLGFFLGVGMGIFARYHYTKILGLGISLAAVFMLLPKMVAVVTEGMLSFRQGVSDTLQRVFPEREFYLGLDAGLALGHPAVMSLAVVMIPVTLLLGCLLPGRVFLPVTDLVMLSFILLITVAGSGGNFLRAFLLAPVIVVLGLAVAADLAPLCTELGRAAAYQFPEGKDIISSFYAGSLQIPWLLWKFRQYF